MNKVIEGAYFGKKIKLATNKKTAVSVYIYLGSGKKVYLNSDTVESYDILDMERHKGLKQAGVGYVVAGGIGAMAGVVANSGGIKVRINFKDGQVSLIEFNNQFYNYFIRGVYDVQQGNQVNNNTNNVANDINNTTNTNSNSIVVQERKPFPKWIIVVGIILFIIIGTIMNKQLNSGDNLIMKKMHVTREQAKNISEILKRVDINDYISIEYSGEYDNLECPNSKGYVVVYDKYYSDEEERYIKKHVVVYLNRNSDVFYITDGVKEYYRDDAVCFESIVSKAIALDYEILNKDELGNLNISSVEVSHDKIITKGSQEDLDKIASVKAIIDLKENKLVLGYQEIKELKMVAYDSKGQIVNNVEIIPSTCEVAITTQEK